VHSQDDSEIRLLTAISKGDERSFEQLYNIYKDRIYSISLRLCMSSSVAEDMVQEIFLKLWINREKLDQVEHFRAYFYSIARNHIIRALKTIDRTANPILYNAEPIDPSAADFRLLDNEYQNIVRNAICSLSPQQAKVYYLSRESGLKRNEIAVQMGISSDTVKTHLSQAIKNIRAFCLIHSELLLLASFLKIILVRTHPFA
jgi:RNA polymerase sigma-70 factor (family 1)